MSDLADITRRLGEAHRQWKDGEKTKAQLKDEFFEVITQQMMSGDLAEKLYEVHEPVRENEAIELAEQYNPGWEVSAIRAVQFDYEDGESIPGWEVILVEDPQYKAFQYVNSDDEMVYTKSIVAGSIQLDDERLKECDPDLYEQVTYVPEPERRLRPLDELPDIVLAKLQKYMYEGKPIVKFPAPRKAKAEELNG